MQRPISYKEAGVDMDQKDAFVERIKEMVKSTYGPEVVEGVGNFAALYEISEGRFLASGTDGVGTKLKVAQLLGIHNTIGIDLVAMCANDVLCTGARMLFFLDYIASGKLEIPTLEKILEGIVEGCKQAQLALIGGETAEMPGMYIEGEYDLAGFAVGEVDASQLVLGKKVKPGDTLIGLASSGIHSNGFSLVRKLILPEETDLLKQALVPTRIYCRLIHRLLKKSPELIQGMAHITGGGFWNICRINTTVDYEITGLPSLKEIPEIFTVLKERSLLRPSELYQIFNMGIGFVLSTNQPERLSQELKDLNETHWIIGKIVPGQGDLKIYHPAF